MSVVVMEGDEGMEPTLGSTGSVRLIGSRHVDCDCSSICWLID